MAKRAFDNDAKAKEIHSGEMSPDDLKSQLSEEVLRRVKDYLVDYWKDVIDVLIDKLVEEGADIDHAKEQIRSSAVNLLEEKGAEDVSSEVGTMVDEIWDELGVSALIKEKVEHKKETADQQVIRAVEEWWKNSDKEALYFLDSEDRKNIIFWEIEAEIDAADPNGEYVENRESLKKNLIDEISERARKERKNYFEKVKKEAEKPDEILTDLQEYADSFVSAWLGEAETWNELVLRKALESRAIGLIDPNHPNPEAVAEYYIDALRFEGKTLHEMLIEEKRKRSDEREGDLILYPSENEVTGDLEREVHSEIMEKFDDWVVGSYRRGELQGIQDLGWVVELKVDAVLGDVDNLEVLGDREEIVESYKMALESLVDYWLSGAAEESLEKEKTERENKERKEREERVKALKEDAFSLRMELEEGIRKVRSSWWDANAYTRDFSSSYKELGPDFSEDVSMEVMEIKSETGRHINSLRTEIDNLGKIVSQTKGAFKNWTDAAYDSQIWDLLEEVVVRDSIMDAESILRYTNGADFSHMIDDLEEKRSKNYIRKPATESVIREYQLGA